MKVLMTTDALGGVWTYALALANGLKAKGVEVRLLVLGPAPDAMLAKAAGLDLIPLDLNLEWRDKAGRLSTEAAALLRAAERDFEPDVVHVNGYREAAAGFKAPVVAVAHSCVRTWWRTCRGEDLPPEWDAYKAGVREGLKAAAILVAPTHAYLTAFKTAWGAVPRAQVIPNGLDLQALKADKQEVILGAGRLWDQAKNVEALEAVAANLPWPVRLAGERPRSGLEEATVALGQLTTERLYAEMAAAPIFVSAARYEPFGLCVLEAAAQGCALVLSDIPGFLELWEGAARFVNPDDWVGLQAVLEELIRDEAARAELGARAQRRAGRYTATAMTDAYLALYKSLLANHPRGVAA